MKSRIHISHVMRDSTSENFDCICTLCQENDGSTQGLAKLFEPCIVGKRFDQSHSLFPHARRTRDALSVRCATCDKDTNDALVAKCAGLPVKKPLTPDEVLFNQIRADRMVDQTVVVEKTYEFYTPYGMLAATGPQPAAEYVADLIASDTAFHEADEIERRREVHARLMEPNAIYEELPFITAPSDIYTYTGFAPNPFSPNMC